MPQLPLSPTWMLRNVKLVLETSPYVKFLLGHSVRDLLAHEMTNHVTRQYNMFLQAYEAGLVDRDGNPLEETT